MKGKNEGKKVYVHIDSSVCVAVRGVRGLEENALRVYRNDSQFIIDSLMLMIGSANNVEKHEMKI